jgi:hypothetical protein
MPAVRPHNALPVAPTARTVSRKAAAFAKRAPYSFLPKTAIPAAIDQ